MGYLLSYEFCSFPSVVDNPLKTWDPSMASLKYHLEVNLGSPVMIQSHLFVVIKSREMTTRR